MKYLVTGCAGFIGSNFCRMLLDKGHTVFGIDALTYSGNTETILDFKSNPKFASLMTDIGIERTVGKLLKDFSPDIVVNFAAESHVDHSIDRPILFVENNVLSVCKFLEMCRVYWHEKGKPENFRFIQISTDEVYGSSVTGEFIEHRAYQPSSPYAASKAAADHFVNAYHKTYGMPTIITNCSNNYGPFQYPEKLLPLMIIRGLAGENLPVYGGGLNVRDWIHVTDHCSAVMHLATVGVPGQTYLIGASKQIKNIDLVQQVCRLLDIMAPRANQYSDQIIFVEDRPGHDMRYAVDWSKLKSTGWIPRVTFIDGLKMTIEWYINNRQWVDSIGAKTYRQGLSKH